ncbi:peptidoglycan D,D-transpeptidase FtsI family protein [Anaerococcus degeneri]|uniref:Penicillin-binding protein 2 n=1 Tax=Anaerococcus degeneri TaxID=361500 RepID=A0ABS7YZL9_9FIRM|nr:penicillin-binding protein 2 [Anaerococcus degeneri]MBP2014964.1 peptidoglycan glycosyltransferase [Anaerococcus degeneri]MCA2097172.1 penicillin-binding protein 2 [Anaerococcus degeneri]
MTDKKPSKKRTTGKSFIDKIKEVEEKQRYKENSQLKVLTKSTLNKRLVFVMVFFVFLFMFVALYLVYFQLFKAKSLADNSHNRRLWLNEDLVKRGSIYDRNENVLAYSEKDGSGKQVRIYNYPQASAPVTGYSSNTYGKTGIEKSYNKELLAISGENFSNFRKMVVKNDTGNDLHLSLDQNIQNIVYNYLSAYKGSCVIMNPSTGQILAMVSTPSFNPNTLDNDWNNLIQTTDGRLVNRATLGLYRPGSVFKIITSASILENKIDTSYKDEGSEIIQGFEIKNYGDQIFGNLDLRSAFINSANTYFANKAVNLGKDKLAKTSEKFVFNKDYEFDLDKNNSVIPFKDLNEADLAMTGFGYGKTQITPLHMAMITSAIANDGVMMRPRLVDKITNKEKEVIFEADDEVLSKATSEKTANTIRDMMVEVVNSGTGTNAYLNWVQLAGKTGTADKADGNVDAWFVGFAPAYEPKIAFALVIEDSQGTGGEVAAPLARNMVRDIFNTITFN